MSLDASVIIPVRNGEAWLRDQLVALAQQDFAGRWEVVVADNGSTDSTKPLVLAFSATAPMSVRWVDASARAGASHARNSGAVASHGKILAFCDSDDRVAPGWLSAAVAAVGSADFAAGLNRELTEPQDPLSPVINPGGVMKGTRINAFVSCNVAVRRESYFRVGGFDESLPPYGCEDIELAVRADMAKMSVVGCEDMVVYFRKTEGVRTILRKVILSAKAETILWHRHADQFAHRSGFGVALRELALAPLVAARLLARRHPNPRFAAREVVTRLGHFIAEVEYARGKYPRTSLLLSPDNDPQRSGG